MDHIQATARNPIVLSSGKGRKTPARFTKTEIHEKCTALCWVPAEGITVTNGRDKGNIVNFIPLTTEEKQGVKDHILSYLAALDSINKTFKTLEVGKRELIPESLILDLTHVHPLPLRIAQVLGQVPDKEETDPIIVVTESVPVADTEKEKSKATVVVAESTVAAATPQTAQHKKESTGTEASAPPQQSSQQPANQPTFAQKILNPTTLGFGVLCAITAYLVTKHSNTTNN